MKNIAILSICFLVCAYGVVLPQSNTWTDTYSKNANGPNGAVMKVFADSLGFFIAGQFSEINSNDTTLIAQVGGLARWNGSAWAKVGSGTSNGTNGSILALTGNKTSIYIGGAFDTAGTINANRIAKWNGTSWSALGSGVKNGLVSALAIKDANIYAGGSFDTVGTTIRANGIAKWNGISWSALGTGLKSSTFYYPTVNALAVKDTNIYAGGLFDTAGASSVRNIAKWNGTSWSTLGNGIKGKVNTIAVMGTDIFVGGEFDSAGTVAARNIAKWNGSSWSALGNGIDGEVYTLTVDGNDLYVGGRFTKDTATRNRGIVKWANNTWALLGGGLSAIGYSAHIYDGILYVGGNFRRVGDTIYSPFVTAWQISPPLPLNNTHNNQPLATISGIQFNNNYPNPFVGNTKISFTLLEPGWTKIRMINADGEIIADLVTQYFEAGEHVIEWNAGELKNTVVYCQILQNGQAQAQKIMLKE